MMCISQAWVHTIELLQDSFHSPRTTATTHGDVELVLVIRHYVVLVDDLFDQSGWDGDGEGRQER